MRLADDLAANKGSPIGYENIILPTQTDRLWTSNGSHLRSSAISIKGWKVTSRMPIGSPTGLQESCPFGALTRDSSQYRLR